MSASREGDPKMKLFKISNTSASKTQHNYRRSEPNSIKLNNLTQLPNAYQDKSNTQAVSRASLQQPPGAAVPTRMPPRSGVPDQTPQQPNDGYPNKVHIKKMKDYI